jgi:hypothetical protein
MILSRNQANRRALVSLPDSMNSGIRRHPSADDEAIVVRHIAPYSVYPNEFKLTRRFPLSRVLQAE